jgi:hypothetical protein
MRAGTGRAAEPARSAGNPSAALFYFAPKFRQMRVDTPTQGNWIFLSFTMMKPA